ncbi:MAG: PQQ-binding-like beta-propeller repeat protein [Deltaproteobacteria bacterium]|jgi:outer membrane protein assembly factor BamB|nr:PQQ-binding-like beta-propeller repeat protein [Deltaproteobacteria bacterium]
MKPRLTGQAKSTGALFLAILLLLVGLGSAPSLAESPYSEGGWATLHRSGANRRFAGDVPLSGSYRRWQALEGASVLTAPTLAPGGQRFYVTTGQGKGAPNLHAFSIQGELLWQAEPWRDAESGVDPCAILSSAIVDREGNVYIGDCNQLFAFRPDGRLKWVVPLPAPQRGDWQPSETLPINAFTTAVFTREGHVAGITNFGDVVVVDRATGRALTAPNRLPGLLPPPSAAVPMATSVFGDGLMAEEIREWAWQLLFGGHMRSANTPAVDEASGRIFVAATSTNEGLGALYALDLVSTRGADGAGFAARGAGAPLTIRIAHATDMGPGSGSSPALSPDGRHVYVSDEEGVFYAIDAREGGIVWQVETKSTAAAAAVGGDGTIYSLQADGPALVAISPGGEIAWESDLSRLTTERLPSSWLLGDPVALGNGNPTVLSDRILVPVIYGYETRIGRRIPWPVDSTVVAIDAATGEGLIDVVALPDDSTGITVALPDGTLINSLGTALTSGVRPLAPVARWLLPGGLEPLPAVGGIQVSRPQAR